MLFSVIIPVYNAAPYLRTCLDSVLVATAAVGENDAEILCVDDGSTDGSSAILDQYAEKVRNSAIPNSSFVLPRFLVVHQPNRGVSAARNAALKIAQGDYVCFVDADDLVESDWLSVYKLAIAESSADLVRSGGESGPVCADRLCDWLWSTFVFDGYPWKYVIKREVAVRAEFPLGVVMSEDAIYAARLVGWIKSAYQLGLMRYNHVVRTESAMFRSLPSKERLLYLQAWNDIVCNNSESITSVEKTVVSHCVSDGILAWLSRPADVECKCQLRNVWSTLRQSGCAEASSVRMLYRWSYMIYAATGWMWPSRVWNIFVEVLVRFKHCINKENP